MLEDLLAGDEVAILARLDSPPEEVRHICRIVLLGRGTVQLKDRRIYSRDHRWGLTAKSTGYIVRTTNEHRAAIRRRARSLPSLGASSSILDQLQPVAI